MDCPPSMRNVGKDEYTVLRKSIYGMAKETKAIEILRKLDFTEGYVNSCLYMKKNKRGLAYISLCR